MAVSQRGAISFGLVHIPVALYTATKDSDIHFNQLCKDDKSRIRYKKVCAHCGKEVSSKDIVKGFEYDEDKYVIMTEDDFESAKTEQDKTISILHFTDLTTIKPVYYEKAYHVLPESGGDKAYNLLYEAMKRENKVAIAKTVMGTKEKLIVLIPDESGILLQTMFFYDELKSVPKQVAPTTITQAEIDMATTLINTMSKTYEPELYKDEYQVRLKEIIEMKINGQEIISATPEKKTDVIDLMDALTKSVEQVKDKELAGRGA